MEDEDKDKEHMDEKLNKVITREKVKRKLRTISMGKTKLNGNNILFLHCIPFLNSFLSK